MKMKIFFVTLKKIALLLAFVIATNKYYAQPGAALNFNGSTSVVNTGSAITLALKSSTLLTVEAWVKCNATNSVSLIVGSHGTPGGLSQFSLRLVNGKYEAMLGAGGTLVALSGANTAIANTWQHVAMTWANGSSLLLYINGVLAGSYSNFIHNMNITTSPINMGNNAFNEAFNGSIDEIRIWKRQLCQAEIQYNMNNEITLPNVNLLAYYQFNQGLAGGSNTTNTTLVNAVGSSGTGTLSNFSLSGSTSNWVTPGGVTSGNTVAIFPFTSISSTNITSGQSVTLTPNNGVTYTFSPAGPFVTPTITTIYTVVGTNSYGCNSVAFSTVGIFADGLNFDGVNDYVNVGSSVSSSLTNTKNITVEAWVKPTTTTNIAEIVGNYNNPFNQMQFMIRRDYNYYTFWINNGANYAQVGAVGTVTLNTWTHLAGTWDGSTMKIYINGSLSGSIGQIGTLPTISNSICIGGAMTYSNCFNGSIDEVRIWNRTLCITEIQNNMNGELALPQNGLLAYYQFNQGLFGAPNSTVTIATNAVNSANTGTLTNMLLNSTISNWVSPSVLFTGVNATSFLTPTMSVAGPSVTCSGSTAVFNAFGTNSYTWNSAVTNSVFAITPISSINFTVIGADINGCLTDMFKATLNVNALPILNIVSSKELACRGEAISLSASGAATYTWNTNENTAAIVISPNINTIYTLTGTDANNCKATAVITQYVSDCTGIENVKFEFENSEFQIYPNPTDGSFTLKSEIEHINIKIINLMGETVFETEIQKGENKVDSNLNKGIYFVIDKNNTQQFKKLSID